MPFPSKIPGRYKSHANINLMSIQSIEIGEQEWIANRVIRVLTLFSMKEKPIDLAFILQA
jgi:hypothetical protein